MTAFQIRRRQEKRSFLNWYYETNKTAIMTNTNNTAIMTNALRRVLVTSPDDLVAMLHITLGRIAPSHEGLELGVCARGEGGGGCVCVCVWCVGVCGVCVS